MYVVEVHVDTEFWYATAKLHAYFVRSRIFCF